MDCPRVDVALVCAVSKYHHAMNEICEHKNKPDTCRECHPSPSFKICEGSSSGCSSPTCPAHRSSLQELLKEFEKELEDEVSKSVPIRQFITSAYELGVAEERARLAAELCDVCKGLVVPAK